MLKLNLRQNQFYIKYKCKLEAEPGAVCAAAVVWGLAIAGIQVILEDSALTKEVTVLSALTNQSPYLEHRVAQDGVTEVRGCVEEALLGVQAPTSTWSPKQTSNGIR